MKEHVTAILNSYSGIFFLSGPRIGLLLLAITMVNPNIAAAGIIAVLSAYFFARFLNMEQEFLDSGFYTYNTLLVGLSVGALFKVSFLTFFFLTGLGILTFLVTLFLYSTFSQYLKLPILSIPFVIVSSIAYLASGRYAGLFVTSLYPHTVLELGLPIPTWLSGYFISLGTILFLPNVQVGILFALILLFASRILFMLSLAGYYSGSIITGMMIGSFEKAFSNPNHFNYILIMIALGGIYLVPSLKSYLMALLAVICSTVILDSVQVFWSAFGIPAFTLPFNLITLMFVYALGLLRFPLVVQVFRGTPEKNLDHYLSEQLRFQGEPLNIALPFAGEWTVWQDFDGEWTHKGIWKHAYDFVITDAQEHAFQGQGLNAADYYAFRKPILSPTRGRVIRVVNHLVDNPIGEVDKVNSWGNLVIIEDTRGFFVELSHLACGSIQVKEGDWVEQGVLLGHCGNSGYSPQPHLHIQVQGTAEIGSYTLPFSFLNYQEEGQHYANALPSLGKKVGTTVVDRQLDRKTTFILDDCFSYEVISQGKQIDSLQLLVKMAVDGTFYWETDKGKLYFGKHEGTFYLYRVEGKDPWLNLIFLALPRVPLAYRQGMRWEDFLTIDSSFTGFRKVILLFLSSFHPKLSQVLGSYQWTAPNIIEGKLSSTFGNLSHETYLELDESTGFKSIRVNQYELRRIYDEPTF